MYSGNNEPETQNNSFEPVQRISHLEAMKNAEEMNKLTNRKRNTIKNYLSQPKGFNPQSKFKIPAPLVRPKEIFKNPSERKIANDQPEIIEIDSDEPSVKMYTPIKTTKQKENIVSVDSYLDAVLGRDTQMQQEKANQVDLTTSKETEEKDRIVFEPSDNVKVQPTYGTKISFNNPLFNNPSMSESEEEDDEEDDDEEEEQLHITKMQQQPQVSFPMQNSSLIHQEPEKPEDEKPKKSVIVPILKKDPIKGDEKNKLKELLENMRNNSSRPKEPPRPLASNTFRAQPQQRSYATSPASFRGLNTQIRNLQPGSRFDEVCELSSSSSGDYSQSESSQEAPSSNENSAGIARPQEVITEGSAESPNESSAPVNDSTEEQASLSHENNSMTDETNSIGQESTENPTGQESTEFPADAYQEDVDMFNAYYD